jgi:hypothetical protein
MNLMNIKKNILIGRMEETNDILFDNKMMHNIFTLNKYQFDNFFEYIERFSAKELIGRIILMELGKKVINPNRLLKISEEYNTSFDDIINNYYVVDNY